MVENAAYDYIEENIEDEKDFELIGGEKFFMSAAAPNVNHLTIVMRLGSIFTQYIDKNNIKAIVMADPDVYLSETEHYRPDLVLVRDLETVKNGKKVYGVPDLVVEVLSISTMDNDLGPKKSAYEKYGVKEYWIVDQWSKRIEVYHLVDGKFAFTKSYKFDADDEDNCKTEIKVSVFDDMIVDVRDVFKWWIA